MGNTCTTQQAVVIKRHDKKAVQQSSSLGASMHPITEDDNNDLMMMIDVPGIERFEGDAVESVDDGFGTSITAAPQEVLSSVRSVTDWFESMDPSMEETNDEQVLVSPSSHVDDEMKNDTELAEAERLAPTGHYDATSQRDKLQILSAKKVDPLMIKTPKLPPKKKTSFFSF